MWHNVRARFDALGITNVVWVMNFMGYEGWNCVENSVWPGNDYVDWVMWDPYPRNATWAYHVGGFYNWLTTHSDAEHNYLSKPWGLAEFGNNGTSQANVYQMYDDAKRALDNGTYPRIKAYVGLGPAHLLQLRRPRRLRPLLEGRPGRAAALQRLRQRPAADRDRRTRPGRLDLADGRADGAVRRRPRERDAST